MISLYRTAKTTKTKSFSRDVTKPYPPDYNKAPVTGASYGFLWNGCPAMSIVNRFIVSALHLLPPESAHEVTIAALQCGFGPVAHGKDDPALAQRLWGLDFPNFLGLAAGFDKNAQALLPLLRMGFGFVEAGTVTPRPQEGNPRPRIFRLPRQRALINHLGFNNIGLEAFTANLHAFRERGVTPGLVGANISQNKGATPDGDFADYVAGMKAVAALADYVVVNISSPNTPGLRGLQNKQDLAALIARVKEARASAVRQPPLLVKISPDLDEQGRQDIADVALATGLDGLVVSNTTVSRSPELPASMANQPGGLSGAPLFDASTQLLADMYRLTHGQVPMIGAGGVGNGAQAYAKIRAGASLVQLYTALIYKGAGLVGQIKHDVAELLRRDGYGSIQDAVGADHRAVVTATKAR